MKKRTHRPEINRNDFLSECFQRDVYLLDISKGRALTEYSQRIEQICATIEGLGDEAYVICKHSLSDTQTIRALEACGFWLMSVDATLTLRRGTYSKRKYRKVPGVSIERVGDRDATHFTMLLEKKRRFFDNTQFYRSWFLDDSLCDRLYKKWIMNDARGRTEENYVAVNKGKVSGFMFCQKKRGEAVIDLIWVDEKLREQGVGTSLILNLAKNNRYRKITANTQLTNYDALRMYQNLGFEIRQTYAVFHWTRKEST